MADTTYTYLGAYETVTAAEQDFQTLKDLRDDDLVHIYDMAVVANDSDGKTQIVDRSQKSLQHGMEGGALVGLLLGEIPGAVIAGAIGALVGHKRKGFSGDDVKKLGEALKAGQAALVVVGDAQLASAVEGAMAGALWRAKGTIDADIQALEAAAR